VEPTQRNKADNPTAPAFVRYLSNSGHWAASTSGAETDRSSRQGVLPRIKAGWPGTRRTKQLHQPTYVRFWIIADNVGFWPGLVKFLNLRILTLLSELNDVQQPQDNDEA
jgi:hypothetical protein